MAELVFGLGPGLFAVIFTAIVMLLVALALSYLAPGASVFIFIGCACVPALIFGIIVSAPFESKAQISVREEASRVSAHTIYRNDGLFVSNSPIVDVWLPVRVLVLALSCLGVLIGIAYQLVLVLQAPPYVCPKVMCRRRQLQQLHPTWYFSR